jgi:hypothetical protein
MTIDAILHVYSNGYDIQKPHHQKTSFAISGLAQYFKFAPIWCAAAFWFDFDELARL